MKKLTKKQKAKIYQKHDYEGNLLDYGAESFFKGSEYEERVKKLVSEYEWFSELIFSFESCVEDSDD